MATPQRKRRQRGSGSLTLIRDGVWRGRVDVIDSYGKKRKESKLFYAEKKPNQIFEEWKVSVRKDPPAPEKATVSDLTDFWDKTYRQPRIEAGQCSYKTAEYNFTIINRIKKHFGDKIAIKLTLMDFKNFVDLAYREKLNDAYIRRHVYILKKILRYAHKHQKADLTHQLFLVDDEELREKRYKSNKKLDFDNVSKLELGEIKAIQDYAKKSNNMLLYRLIETVKLSGLRRGEVLALRDQCILDDRLLVVKQLAKEKGKPLKLCPTKNNTAMRAVPMISQLKKVIEEQMVEREKNKAIVGAKNWQDHIGDLIFTHEDGRPINPNLFDEWFRKARRAVGLRESLKPHTLRHYFNSLLNSLDVSSAVRIVFLGHTEEDFNERVYTYPFTGDILKATQKLEEHVAKEEQKNT